ncbi:MAG: hydroxymethylglutaryl-CoA reductase, degradative [Croceitalea sp.]|nr:hydroxymethylglutaryl-CoA reductase, degradative [Croceitalea sp.]MBT8237969.1 hydroxymethylglutaryl-CoA reductase, degradative [Croceitalea sp.]NNC35224.1 hydroxymethylglutaryl-CoA reductase, degradative [Croceitalea sp.]
MLTVVEGFSKFSKEDKIDWIAKNCTSNADETKRLLKKYWNENPRTQRIHDEFIENTLSNYYLPFAVAPNFKINEKLYAIPMAIEESSVVAAASKAAKFWLNRGGFKTTVLGTEKVGQVHFMFDGNKTALRQFFDEVKPLLFETTSPITQSMTKRGGGIQDIVLIDKTQLLSDYYQLHCTFETVDAMGANFINSCLEQISKTFEAKARLKPNLLEHGENLTIVMSILSNYVPNCIVRAEVSCKVEELNDDELKASLFAEKMIQAVNIAKVEPYRAVTHNKGIMNGIDAVILATGNDFRAVEAGIHAYASKNGVYSSLTHAEIKDGVFKFWMEIPLALGTVGGLTSLHPLVKLALEILQQPTAKELMQIVAVAGLAQNFAALRSLVTTGIQKGHMKMHLLNMLSQMGANEQEKNELVVHFKDKTVNNANVRAALQKLQAK